jgi:hypothetical protein
MSMRRVLSVTLTVLAALVLALVVGTATAPGGSAAATGSQTYTDPAGDAKGAPDLLGVAISDAAGGTISITVTAAGFASSTAPWTQVVLYLNTDMNPTTGSINQLGAEYRFGAGKDSTGDGGDMERWDGSRYVQMAQSPTMSFSRSGDALTWTANKSDLGNTTAFSFFAWSSTWDANDNMLAEDDAPDSGIWLYALSPPVAAPAPPPTTTTTPSAPVPAAKAVKPVIGAPIVVPLVATAGKRFTVAFPVTRSDTGAPLMNGQMICDPSVKGKVIQHAEQYANGTARLSLVIPKTAKGNSLLKVKLTIVAGPQAASRIATFHVR